MKNDNRWEMISNDESIKCLGVYKDCHYYFDGKHKEFFLLTPNFRITRYPKRYDEKVAQWCDNRKKSFLLNEMGVNDYDGTR